MYTLIMTPLTYILTTAMLDVTGHHLEANLANYNFRLHYKSGKSNVEADALSRITWDRVIDQKTVKSLMVNAEIKSNVVVEVYVGSTVT